MLMKLQVCYDRSEAVKDEHGFTNEIEQAYAAGCSSTFIHEYLDGICRPLELDLCSVSGVNVVQKPFGVWGLEELSKRRDDIVMYEGARTTSCCGS